MRFILDLIDKWAVKKVVREAKVRGCYKEFVGSFIPGLLGFNTCGTLVENGIIYIIWDEEFYNSISLNERSFCILHELGHIVNLDVNNYSMERQITDEVSADSYAFKNMTYDGAMDAMRSLYKKLKHDYEREEWRHRMSIQQSIEMAKKYSKDLNIEEVEEC